MDTLTFIGHEPMFASPLVCFRLPEPGPLNALLLAETEARRAASAGMQRSNQGGWHSEDDFFDREEPGARRLAAIIGDAVRAATQQVAPKFDVAAAMMHLEGWINANGPGALNEPHAHPTWAWSGTYYVSVPAKKDGRDGAIEFLDPRGDVSALSVPGATCFRSKARLSPVAGDLILFPSYLIHWVYPHQAAEERVSVAFNARIAEGRPA